MLLLANKSAITIHYYVCILLFWLRMYRHAPDINLSIRSINQLGVVQKLRLQEEGGRVSSHKFTLFVNHYKMENAKGRG